jgi:hypothetical protein
MASCVPLAEGNKAVAVAFHAYACGYCQSLIAPGERWVRVKIDAPCDAEGAHYRRYHADLFGEEVLSCWEKQQLEKETVEPADRPA